MSGEKGRLDSRGGIRRYLTFLVSVGAVTAALLLVGYLPTRSLGGQASVVAMFYACAVSLLSAAVSGVPIARARVAGLHAFKLFVASMVLRLATVAAVGAAVALTAGLDRRPFLLWLALSYLVLLVVDTAYAWRTLGRL